MAATVSFAGIATATSALTEGADGVPSSHRVAVDSDTVVMILSAWYGLLRVDDQVLNTTTASGNDTPSPPMDCANKPNNSASWTR